MNPYESAMHTLPVVYDLIGRAPISVLDIGCHDGQWLQAAQDISRLTNVLGIDVRSQPPKFRKEEYIQWSVTSKPRPKIMYERDWDLVICLEMAEHLQPEDAEGLVLTLEICSGTILFSAAQPEQGPYGEPDNIGMHHNEQPKSYWRELFARHGYRYTDLEPLLSTPTLIQHIDPWYRLNADLYQRG
jgi:hypothetical protein